LGFGYLADMKKVIRKRFLNAQMRGCSPESARFVDELIEDENGVETWDLRAYDPDGEDKPDESARE